MNKLAITLCLALAACTPAHAQSTEQTAAPTAGDPAVVAKGVYTLLLDNDRVRVFDVAFQPGQQAPMHYHPDHVVYVMQDATIRLTGADGKSQDVSIKTGQSLFLPAGPHAAENVGATHAHNLVVELKPRSAAN